MKPSRVAFRLGLAAAVAAAVAAATGAALAGPQLFKCVDGKRTVYQQQACSVSTQPEPVAHAPEAAARAGVEAASAAGRKVTPPPPASSAPAKPR
jgi:hypothetical protein